MLMAIMFGAVVLVFGSMAVFGTTFMALLSFFATKWWFWVLVLIAILLCFQAVAWDVLNNWTTVDTNPMGYWKW